MIKPVVLLCATACLTYVPYVFLGFWNRVFGGWGTVFYCYAGEARFITAYAPPWAIDIFRWRPSPIGVMQQDGIRGVVLASPLTEAEFLNPENAAQFTALQRRIARISRLLGADQIALAGILPGVLKNSPHIPSNDSRDIVVKAVLSATRHLSENHALDPNIILLGGAGHVGQALRPALEAAGHAVSIVDPAANTREFPSHLKGTPCLLIDVARKGVVEKYLDQLWPGMVMLNETFPSPSRKTISALTAKGIQVWHLSGVAGSVTPPLPYGYEDAVPCCAARMPEGAMDVKLVRLGA